MNDFIEQLKESGNELLSAEARSAEAFKNLKHTKADLETLLAFSISEIEFKPKNSDKFQRMVCTSNTRFINVYSALKDIDKRKKIRTPFIGIHTKDPNSVDTYDLVDGKRKTLCLKSWRAINFVMLTEENVLVLDRLVNECLKKR
jgi:hypothetical protein